MSKRFTAPLAVAAAMGVVVSLVVAVPATAGPGAVGAVAAKATILPTQIALPNGFMPEGIAIGPLPVAFFGSRADGDLYRADLITGKGEVFSQGPGTESLGMKIDVRGRLFVAGGTGGDGRVVSAFTGKVLASYEFTTSPDTFVNDVVFTDDAAWFTDSLRPFLYKVPLGFLGQLPTQAKVVAVPLTGDYVHQPDFLNANGISRTPDGKALLVVHATDGKLLRVDPATGVATAVNLGGASLVNGDGLVLEGRTLYVAQNSDNQISVLQLNQAGTSGTLTRTITDPRFDTPATMAAYGNRMYVVNGRFSTDPTPTTPYSAVAVSKS